MICNPFFHQYLKLYFARRVKDKTNKYNTVVKITQNYKKPKTLNKKGDIILYADQKTQNKIYRADL